MTSRRRSTALATAALLVSALAGTVQAASAQAAPPNVLVWSGTYGFRHPSIVDGTLAIAEDSLTTGAYDVTFTENPLDLMGSNLANYDVLVWMNSTGKPPFTETQRDEIIRYAGCGGGTVGLHSAADSNYGWADYAELLGAQFDSHPQNAGAGAVRMLVEAPDHAITQGWGDANEFQLDDEFYRWRTALRMPGISLPRNAPGVEVLLSLDETTVEAGIQDGQLAYEVHQPVAWTKTFRDRGRVFYNNMGHGDTSWNLPAYVQSVHEGILWAAGVQLDDDCMNSDTPLPDPVGPPAADPATIGQPCPELVLTGRTGFTWENSGPAKVLTPSTPDEMGLVAGTLGGLAWGEQTYVLDLSESGAASGTVTFDLTWDNPADDYDLSVTTPWLTYGVADVGSAADSITIEDAPHCAVFQAYGNNMAATGTAGPTLNASVTPAAVAPAPEPEPTPAPAPESPLPTTGGGLALLSLALVGGAVALGRRS